MTATAVEYAAARDALAAIIRTVDDVGLVHTRPRVGDAATHYIADIDGTPQIRAWSIGITDPGVAHIRREQNHRHRYTTWRILGFVGLEDEVADGTIGGYDVILDLAGQIADAIDADRNLSGAVLDHDPVQIAEPDVVTIAGGAICWAVTLTVQTWSVNE